MNPTLRRLLNWSFPILAVAGLSLVSACGDDDEDAGIADTGGGGGDAGPQDSGTPDAGPVTTLYDRLGANAGIRAAVEGFVGRVVADPKINGYFLNSSVNSTRLVTCLTKQLNAVSGGPATYPATGAPADADGCRNMKDAHMGRGISTNDFTDLAGHLLAELQSRNVSAADQNTVSTALGGLMGDIVEDATNNATIYQRAGRKPAVTTVINDFVGKVVDDPKINGYFLNSSVDASRLTTCLVRQVCGLTGGPCRYGEEVESEIDVNKNGTVETAEVCRTMMATHASLGISTIDFDDLAAHLVAALTSAGVAAADITTITEAVTAPAFKSTIVTDVTNNATIYQRIGRKPAAITVINAFLTRVLADVRINGYFLNNTLNAERLGGCLIRQVCTLTGGPCHYGQEVEAVFDKDADGTIETGEECQGMMAVHAGLGISDLDFNDLANDLVTELTAASVPPADIATITTALTAPAFVATIVEDPTHNATIYQRAGRKTGVVTVIDDFLADVLANNAINGYFLNSSLDTARLRTCLIRQVCGLTGGPCRYGYEVETEIDVDNDGTVEPTEVCRDMMATHMGLGISQNDFNDLAGALVASLTSAGVAAADITTISDALTAPGLVSQIVEDPNSNATVYQRVGRKPAIRTVILDFTSRVTTNNEINGFFGNLTLNRVSRLQTCLIRQTCGIDGPCNYGEEVETIVLNNGGVCRDMATSHAPLRDENNNPINIADFNALVGDLNGALTSAGVAAADRMAILDALAPLCPDIVSGGAGCPP